MISIGGVRMRSKCQLLSFLLLLLFLNATLSFASSGEERIEIGDIQAIHLDALKGMKRLSPNHEVTKSLELWVAEEGSFLIALESLVDGTMESKEAIEWITDGFPRIFATLESLGQLHQKIETGQIYLSLEMRNYWDQFFGGQDSKSFQSNLGRMKQLIKDAIYDATARAARESYEKQLEIHDRMVRIASTNPATQTSGEYLSAGNSLVRLTEGIPPCEGDFSSARCRGFWNEYVQSMERAYVLSEELFFENRRIVSGTVDAPLEFRQIWEDFYSTLEIDENIFSEVDQARQIMAPIRDALKRSAPAIVEATPTPIRPRISVSPVYRNEVIKGQTFRVGSTADVEIWTCLICINSSCTKTKAQVFVSNRGEPFTIVPGYDIALETFDKKGVKRKVTAWTANEWIRNEQNKANWKLIGAALLVGLANSGPTGTVNGTFSGTDQYGSSFWGSYSGTYTDYAERSRRISGEFESFAQGIASGLTMNTVGLFFAETLSRGEEAGGIVYFRKLKRGAQRARLIVRTGKQQFRFEYRLK